MLKRTLASFLFLLFCLTQSAWAVLAIDPNGSSSATAIFTTTNSGTITISTTNANDIIVIMVSNSFAVTAPTVQSISSTHTTGWVKVVGNHESLSGADNDVEIWSGLAAGALTSEVFTVTLTGSTSDATIIAFAVSGANTTTPWDVNGSASGVNQDTLTTTPTVSSLSTTNTNTMLIGCEGFNNVTLATAGTIAGQSGNLIGAIHNGGGALDNQSACQYLVVSSAQSGVSNAFGNTHTGWVMVADALQQASAGGATVHSLPLLGVGQ